ncbi:hypothetical protein ACFOWT_14410 [Croceibacterium xixiisoli]|uniref:hypothetical protein n=1 Tax=Croceibacterium xixiisoli TaxID=1476466 RepID=UPI001925A17A|nr:hypothetical protein [Croceibacterium xixiisoli]
MIGKIVGAVAGQQLSRQLKGIDGFAGAALGVGAVAVARRLGPAGMVAAALGSWLIMRNRKPAEPAQGDGKVHTLVAKPVKKAGTVRQKITDETSPSKPAKVQPSDQLAAASPAQ